MNLYLHPDNDHITAVDVTNVEDELLDQLQHCIDTYLEEAQQHQRHMTEFDAYCAATTLLNAWGQEKFGAVK